MKILFDQNTPKPLAKHLTGHEVTRAAQMGWEEVQNGDLLRAAEAHGFDLLISTDKNLAYQQKVSGRSVGVVALSTNNWPELQKHIVTVVAAVDKAAPGQYIEVDCGKFLAAKFKRKMLGPRL